ncbi:MAG: hypothetical protein RIS29_3195 [Bacteroidota bacterium]|jgi:sialate O-acetylesterase
MKIRLFIITGLLLTGMCQAQLWLPRLFTNGMVLQRNAPIAVWGKAMPGDTVKVTLQSQQNSVIVSPDGTWKTSLPALIAGGPYTLSIQECGRHNETKLVEDVLVGDVWLASGQSNMELKVSEAAHAKKEIAQANYPSMRFFIVPHKKDIKVNADVSGGSWKRCDSSKVGQLSAVAYYFSRKIHTEQGVPVGIIQSTWGGSPVEAWTSREMLLSSAITRQRMFAIDSVGYPQFDQDSLHLIHFWDIVYHPQNGTDTIVAKPEYADKDWKELKMPSTVRSWKMFPYEGMVWFRKNIVLSKEMLQHPVSIHLGHPELNYSLYVNGHEVAHTIWNAAKNHSYSIPAEYLHAGKNLIALRIAVLWGGGGLNPPAKDIYLSAGTDTISLAGNWKYNEKLEPKVPFIQNYQYFPSFLYNGMLAPVIPYTIKGAIWYQGEANDSLAYNYRELFPLMINDWRIRWQQGNFPFLYVQLPNYRKRLDAPAESQWAELREAQSMAQRLPNTGMACAVDLGLADNIHPLNKQDVGMRLAQVALNKVYGESNNDQLSPQIASYQIKKDTVYVTIDQKQLKTTDGQPVRGFAVAGEDRKFYFAEAEIKNNLIKIHCKQVKHPMAVRYAWADNPDCNIMNANGFPLVPFRSDCFKGITQK